MDRPDQRLSLHWRTSSHRQEMTDQEKALAEWLESHDISFRYEQLQLIKNNDIAGKTFSEGKKVKKKDVLRGVPDFVFEYGAEHFVIEVTERRRPESRRPHRRQQDPKRLLRHRTRLAQLDCAIIYRNELQEFFRLFEELSTQPENVETPPVSILRQTIQQWIEKEWADPLY